MFFLPFFLLKNSVCIKEREREKDWNFSSTDCGIEWRSYFPYFLCDSNGRLHFVWGRSTSCCYGNLAENQPLLSHFEMYQLFLRPLCVRIFSSHLLHPLYEALIQEREYNHTPIALYTHCHSMFIKQNFTCFTWRY